MTMLHYILFTCLGAVVLIYGTYYGKQALLGLWRAVTYAWLAIPWKTFGRWVVTFWGLIPRFLRNPIEWAFGGLQRLLKGFTDFFGDRASAAGAVVIVLVILGIIAYTIGIALTDPEPVSDSYPDGRVIRIPYDISFDSDPEDDPKPESLMDSLMEGIQGFFDVEEEGSGEEL